MKTFVLAWYEWGNESATLHTVQAKDIKELETEIKNEFWINLRKSEINICDTSGMIIKKVKLG